MSAQLSGNSLSVQTTIFPLVQLHINRLELGVNTRWMIQKYSLGTAKESKWSVYRFAADCNREPCFSDGDAELSPQSLAEKLLEPIFDIF